MIQAEANSNTVFPAVISVTSTHVTWTKKISNTQAFSGQFSGIVNMEIWEGFASSQLSSESVTIDFDRAPDGAEINFIAISGCPLTSPPFDDPTGTLPAFGVSSAAHDCSVTFSTVNNDNVIIEWVAVGNSAGAPAISSGYTSQLGYDDHGPPVWDFASAVATKIVSSPQSGVTIHMGDSNAVDGMMVAFTVTGDAADIATVTTTLKHITQVLDVANVANSAAITTTLKHITESASVSEPPVGMWHSTETDDFTQATGFAPITLLPPELDGVGGVGTTDGSSTLTLTITTVNSDDIIVLNIFNTTGAALRTVVAISDQAGLFWQRRTQFQVPNGAHATNYDQEIWWAFAANPLDADEITIDFSGTVDDAAAVALAANGCNLTDPFDGDEDLPATNYFDGTLSESATVTFTTLNPSAILLGFYGSFYAYATSLSDPNPSAPSPWEVYNAVGTDLGPAFAYAADVYNVISDGVDSTTATISCLADAWGMIGDALIPPSITFDAYARGGTIYSPKNQVTIETFNGDILLLFVYGVGTDPAVSTVTDSESLTWHRRAAKVVDTSYYYQPTEEVAGFGGGTEYLTGNSMTLEVWWAASPGHVTTTITVEFTETPLTQDLFAVSVNGVNAANPWDINSSLPNINSGSGNVDSADDNLGVGNTGIFTTAKQTLTFNVVGSPGALNWGGAINYLFDPLHTLGEVNGYNYWGFWWVINEGMELTFLGAANSGIQMAPPFYFEDMMQAQFKLNTAPVSGEEVGWGGPFNPADYQGVMGYGVGGLNGPPVGWVSITDALVAGFTSGNVYGEFRTSEKVDTFLAAGYSSGAGTWTSTEAHDTFATVGFSGPIIGTMAPTEFKDQFRGGPQPTNQIVLFVT